jgi:hypothetical protein
MQVTNVRQENGRIGPKNIGKDEICVMCLNIMTNNRKLSRISDEEDSTHSIDKNGPEERLIVCHVSR